MHRHKGGRAGARRPPPRAGGGPGVPRTDGRGSRVVISPRRVIAREVLPTAPPTALVMQRRRARAPHAAVASEASVSDMAAMAARNGDVEAAPLRTGWLTSARAEEDFEERPFPALTSAQR